MSDDELQGLNLSFSSRPPSREATTSIEVADGINELENRYHEGGSSASTRPVNASGVGGGMEGGPTAGIPGPSTNIARLNALMILPESENLLPLTALLRSADEYRMKAQQCERDGDVEGAFVAYGIAAKYALELIPTHEDYGNTLTREQRSALEKVCNQYALFNNANDC